MFLRLLPKIEVTGTFKYRKLEIWSRDGFDPNKVKDPLYVRGERGYQKLTKAVFEKLMSGEMRI